MFLTLLAHNLLTENIILNPPKSVLYVLCKIHLDCILNKHAINGVTSPLISGAKVCVLEMSPLWSLQSLPLTTARTRQCVFIHFPEGMCWNFPNLSVLYTEHTSPIPHTSPQGYLWGNLGVLDARVHDPYLVLFVCVCAHVLDVMHKCSCTEMIAS